MTADLFGLMEQDLKLELNKLDVHREAFFQKIIFIDKRNVTVKHPHY